MNEESLANIRQLMSSPSSAELAFIIGEGLGYSSKELVKYVLNKSKKDGEYVIRCEIDSIEITYKNAEFWPFSASFSKRFPGCPTRIIYPIDCKDLDEMYEKVVDMLRNSYFR